MAICRNCGLQTQDGLPQCPRCGAPMMQTMNQMPNQQGYPNMNYPQPKKKSGCVLIAIVVFVCIFVLPAVVNGYNKRESEKQGGASNQQQSDSKTDSEKRNNTSSESSAEEKFNPNDYSKLKYDTIIHAPDGNKGQKFTCTGKIIQVLDDSYRLQIGNSLLDSDVVMVDYKLSEGEQRIVEDDYVTVWGVSEGLITYTTVLKSELTIPRISADKIDRITEDEYNNMQFSEAKAIEVNLEGSSEDFHVLLQSAKLQHMEENDSIYLFFEFTNIADKKQYIQAAESYVDGYKTEYEYSSKKINGYNGFTYESIEAGKKYQGYIKYKIPSDWQTLEITEEDIVFTINRSEFGSNEEAIILEAGEENEYSEKLTVNAGTETEENLIIYVLPAGKYSVRNIAEKPDQFNVYSKETVTTEEGREEPAEIGFVKLLQPEESAEFEMKDNQYIEIHEPAKFEITAIE